MQSGNGDHKPSGVWEGEAARGCQLVGHLGALTATLAAWQLNLGHKAAWGRALCARGWVFFSISVTICMQMIEHISLGKFSKIFTFAPEQE